MEITGVAAQTLQDPRQARLAPQAQNSAEIAATIQKLTKVGLAFDRRLQFSVDDKSNEVVVKVIDQETEKVIKEIPSRELQIVHERIKEALGLLFDERI